MTRMLPAVVVGLVLALAVQRSDSFATTAGGAICRDVASAAGLAFRGDYGPALSGDEISQSMQRNMGNGAAVADVFGDGALDVLLLGQQGHPNRLFRNMLTQTGRPTFVDVTDEAGLANTGGGRAAVFADLNNDGAPDLVVVNDYQPGVGGTPSRIYRNDGAGHFSDVTASSGFDPTGYIVGGVALADYNRTGRLSIYVSYWTEEVGGDPNMPDRMQGRFPGGNRLFENLGNFTFKDVTQAAGLDDVHVDTFTAIFTDFDGDGWPDLYLAFDHRPDRFYRNAGGHFEDDSRAAGVNHVGNDMGVAAGDVNGDGRIDLYSTNITDHDENFGNRPAGNTLLMGDGAAGTVHLTDVATSQGVYDGGWGWGAAFVDLNLDGYPDIYTVQGFREFVGDLSPSLRDGTARLFLADESGGFVAAPEAGCDLPGDQRALIPFDYDRDGAPDLLITQVGLPTLLLHNQTTGRHWLTVVPDPRAGPTNGVWVTVRSEGHTQRQLILASSSYLSGMPQEAYFGLGRAAVADEVVIDWADGRTLRLSDVAADQLLRVTRAGSPDTDRNRGSPVVASSLAADPRIPA